MSRGEGAGAIIEGESDVKKSVTAIAGLDDSCWWCKGRPAPGRPIRPRTPSWSCSAEASASASPQIPTARSWKCCAVVKRLRASEEFIFRAAKKSSDE